MDIKIMPEKYKRQPEITEGNKSPFIGFLSRLFSQTKFLLFLAIGFLILVILICFGLWGYQKSLIEEKTNLENQLAELNNKRNLELEADFMDLKNGIEDLKKILKNRLYSSQIFEMLEELTLPQVRFANLDADFSQAKLKLEIEAADYTTLAKQVFVFKEDKRIKEISLSGVELSETGRVNSAFDIKINLDFLRSQI
ncbi:MAG: hypothetical protein COS49_00575 [Candidatus Portnoybacteria bacterium CG03_land_8_20_14_0_80_41_10]|uniref:Uncharacterized protein n=1 Tax=Candidatus Portnoybacteria bacterium CG03_land_8_20_14_0_80_41_10 TaxID=1974808 RepID=A0A2M7BV30_9BACT|nr:MAG: hypothetical protein COS49_00575 [Candidatus Portnoybacteria bacterium CG03_land_8_20_14_0_80_41_10]